MKPEWTATCSIIALCSHSGYSLRLSTFQHYRTYPKTRWPHCQWPLWDL